MNKKYLIAGGIIVIFLILLVVLVISQQSSTQQPLVPNPSPAEGQSQTILNQTTHSHNKVVPTATLAPVADTPSDAVKQFYNYYFSSPTNPLANGAYKTNPYLSPDFKQVIGALYNNGDTAVFCPQNKRANITVGKETQLNSTNSLLMQEFISEASPGNKDLYVVLVQEINNKWLIYDINCI